MEKGGSWPGPELKNFQNSFAFSFEKLAPITAVTIGEAYQWIHGGISSIKEVLGRQMSNAEESCR